MICSLGWQCHDSFWYFTCSGHLDRWAPWRLGPAQPCAEPSPYSWSSLGTGSVRSLPAWHHTQWSTAVGSKITVFLFKTTLLNCGEHALLAFQKETFGTQILKFYMNVCKYVFSPVNNQQFYSLNNRTMFNKMSQKCFNLADHWIWRCSCQGM